MVPPEADLARPARGRPPKAAPAGPLPFAHTTRRANAPGGRGAPHAAGGAPPRGPGPTGLGPREPVGGAARQGQPPMTSGGTVSRSP